MVFISLDWLTLGRVASQSPELPIGYVVDSAARFEEALERATTHGNAFVDASSELLTGNPAFADAVLSRGLDLGVWTVDRAETAQLFSGQGVTRFTTNDVEPMLLWSRQA